MNHSPDSEAKAEARAEHPHARKMDVTKDPHLIEAKSEIIRGLGYRITELDGRHILTKISFDTGTMPPEPYPDFWSAFSAAWEEIIVRFDLYMDGGGNIHRKLYDARSAETERKMMVVEHIWPFAKEIIVFEEPEKLFSLRGDRAKAEAERASEASEAGAISPAAGLGGL